MRGGRFLTTLLALAAPACSAAATSITPSDAASTFVRALCFERVWWDSSAARLGQTSTLSILAEGPTAHVWSEDAVAMPYAKRMAASYTVTARPIGPVVALSVAYNADVMRDAWNYKADLARASDPRAVRLKVTIPEDCTPKFDPPTAATMRMRQVVKLSLAESLAHYAPQTPRKVPVVIARFNADYPEAFVLRADTGQVFRIGLMGMHPATDYFGGSYGRYLVFEEWRKPIADRLRPLIRRYGDREILALPGRRGKAWT